MRLICNLPVTVLVLIKLTKFAVPVRFRCGSAKLNFVIFSSCFAIFTNVVHNLDHCKIDYFLIVCLVTVSYSASHKAPNYVKRS